MTLSPQTAAGADAARDRQSDPAQANPGSDPSLADSAHRDEGVDTPRHGLPPEAELGAAFVAGVALAALLRRLVRR